MPALSAALLLADGRLPTGGHAHSLGVEAAVHAGTVTDLADLGGWIEGGLATTWWLDAAVAVQAARLARTGDVEQERWWELDREASARSASPLARRTARALGRQAARTGGVAWPRAPLGLAASAHPDGPLAPVVLGALAGTAGLDDWSTATVSLHGAVQLAVGAGIRLLGLDPFAAAAVVAGLGPTLHEVAVRAADVGPAPRDLPAVGTPVLDLLLAAHDHQDRRLFAS